MKRNIIVSKIANSADRILRMIHGTDSERKTDYSGTYRVNEGFSVLLGTEEEVYWGAYRVYKRDSLIHINKNGCDSNGIDLSDKMCSLRKVC
ncbi:hypothetical protein [Ruminococcus flavefaciens]|uniref:hypothetical protein n=1 Tax=Ruminococcus flavefaciens TaxID=1265 RepID=UPI0026EADA33|nr:hypothetical protein [Ruminococcus flavefaciens]MDD7517559.1 hypothetical protein [Ruminococcus flavefaciens]MDY5692433.1 hypothetical protein [Ruminococcus flavefaciens]